MTPTPFYPLKPPVRRKRKGGADATPPVGAAHARVSGV